MKRSRLLWPAVLLGMVPVLVAHVPADVDAASPWADQSQFVAPVPATLMQAVSAADSPAIGPSPVGPPMAPSRRMMPTLEDGTAASPDANLAPSGSTDRPQGTPADLDLFGPAAVDAVGPGMAPTTSTADDFPVGTSGPGAAAPFSDPADGDLRLVGQADVNGFATGALQVFHNGAFGAVCSASFDAVAAGVACRQLGFTAGTIVPLAISSFLQGPELDQLLEEVRAPFVLENLACDGSEVRLLDCMGSTLDLSPPEDGDYSYYNLDLNDAYCDSGQNDFAFIACGMLPGPGQPPAEGDLRLASGAVSEVSGAQFGRLEVFSNGGWGGVCDRPGARFDPDRADNMFSDASVTVACRQLGFAAGVKITVFGFVPFEEYSRIPFVLSGARCEGNETALTQCPGVEVGSAFELCSLQEVLSIQCFNGSDPGTEGNIRLQDGEAGADFEYGRLEIFRRGFWSNVCDAGTFTPDSARVACRILGYDGGGVLNFQVAYGFNQDTVLTASLPVGLASVDCDGNETSLLQCSSIDVTQSASACGVANSNATDATVLACANSAPGCPEVSMPVEGAVRLRGGFGTLCDPLHTGFVEIFHNNEWGAICNGEDSSDHLVADVVCRQLGYPHGTPVNPLGNAPDSGGSDYDYSFLYAEPAVEEAEEPVGRFWLSYRRVSCNGPEQRLIDCDLGDGFLGDARGPCTSTQNRARFTVACRSFPVAAAQETVTTPGAEEGDVRLVEQSTYANWQLGRLEIFFEGSWGQVCARTFTAADARVACSQLGFATGTVLPARVDNLATGQQLPTTPVPEVALTSPGCNGSEASLLDCQPQRPGLNPSESRECLGDSLRGLEIACVMEPEAGQLGPHVGSEGALRIVDSTGSLQTASASGILEVFHAGAWGSVCMSAVRQTSSVPNPPGLTLPGTEVSALLSCQQLGFVDGAFLDALDSDATLTGTVSPPWLPKEQLDCGDGAERLVDCGGPNYGETALCGPTQEIFCTRSPEPGVGAVRLVGGQEDPDGAWAYGMLKAYDGNIFSAVSDNIFDENFGRRGAQVACRSLGFATGAQFYSRTRPIIPNTDRSATRRLRVQCRGDEASLADCDISSFPAFFDDDSSNSAAIICSTPSSCTPDSAESSQGDVRLVALGGAVGVTTTCDEVHFGGVELFNEGQWGRICSGRTDDFVTLTVDAIVACRQLGFPFGSLYDVFGGENVDEFANADYRIFDDVPSERPEEIVWATDVVCTGKEERLGDCLFPEEFGANPNSDFAERLSGDDTPGLVNTPCTGRDRSVFGVICRRFEIPESDSIRR